MIRCFTTLLFGVALLAGCAHAEPQSPTVFEFDEDVSSDQRPWTSEQFKNDPDHFQFAIIGDRTGGADHRQIFDRAMDQLNLLQPEFVMTVGDFIEGYSEDRDKITAEWDDIDRKLAKLEMPLFRTGGNHDLSNDMMQEVWAERHGPTYYHFVYRDVLFLVLSSEDPTNPAPPDIEEKIELYNELQVSDPKKAEAMLDEFMAEVATYLGKPANFSDAQIAHVEKALQDHEDVRWTFLFLHQPAWENPSEGFLAIEKLLQGRDYTFVAGHLHYYNYEERSGHDYLTMGPAGASFHKDGPGNVDHVLWVTMTDDGPRIAKITLDGIFDRKGRDLSVKEMYDRSKGNEASPEGH